MSTNTQNTKTLNTKAAILRMLDRPLEAERVTTEVLAIDPLDFWATNEQLLAQAMQGQESSARQTLRRLTDAMRGEVQAYLELATDYMTLGMWQTAIDVLRRPVDAQLPGASTYPIVHYYLGYLYTQQGDHDAARDSFLRATSLPVDYGFPFRLEGIDVFDAALQANPADARAHYYLGNLLFDHQPDRAMQCWEKSRELDPSLAMVHRNLGWAYHQTKNDMNQALACYEQALKCSQVQPRLLLELDQLYESANVDPQRRLAALRDRHDVVVKRQESLEREITVLVLTGNYEQAITYLTDNFFHAQEGRDEIHDVYVDAHLLQGLKWMKQNEPSRALDHFRRAAEYPENLSVGRPARDPRAPQIAYYLGTACEALGDVQTARQSYQQAAEQTDTERWPETRFYQAQSLARLGRMAEANEIYRKLVETGKSRLSQDGSVDFFAKFGEQESHRRRMSTAHYLLGLGLLGEGELDRRVNTLSRQCSWT